VVPRGGPVPLGWRRRRDDGGENECQHQPHPHRVPTGPRGRAQKSVPGDSRAGSGTGDSVADSFSE
jgi:hypothetical protein